MPAALLIGPITQPATMLSARNIALGLLAAVAVVSAADADSDVVQLKKDTFDAFIKENSLVLAECKPASIEPVNTLVIPG